MGSKAPIDDSRKSAKCIAAQNGASFAADLLVQERRRGHHRVIPLRFIQSSKRQAMSETVRIEDKEVKCRNLIGEEFSKLRNLCSKDAEKTSKSNHKAIMRHSTNR